MVGRFAAHAARPSLVALVSLLALLAGMPVGLFGAPAGASGERLAVPKPAAAPAFAPAWATSALDQDAPDPHVVRFGSTYYAYTTGTMWGNHIGILRSTRPASGFETITGTKFGSSAFPSIPFNVPLRPWQTLETHAPAVFRRAGKYVMFYAAQTSSGHGGHYCLSVATADHPAGPFTDTSSGPLLCDDAEGGVIDPAPFVDPSGNAWLHYKTYDDVNHSAQPSKIFVVRLSADGRSLGGLPRKVLDQSAMSSPYETVENPQMLVASGVYFLLYSRGDWNTAQYRQGFAVCAGPAGPCTEGSPTSILSSYGAVAGPGGGTVFRDGNGGTWLAYQGWNGSPGCAGYSGTTCARKLYVARITAAGACPAARVPTSGATVPGRSGYWMLGAGGAVYPFGDAKAYGSPAAAMAGRSLAVHIEPTPTGNGYWVLDTSGCVHNFGDARHLGNAATAGFVPGETVASMSATPTGKGYWVFTNRGRALAFGDARSYGDVSKIRLNGPIVASVATASGRGYYMVASDGGIFAFGDAVFLGSMGAVRLNRPVNGIAPDPDGRGYWLVASDGGIFAFQARFRGSMGSVALNKPVIGMVAYGNGYLLVASDGGIFSFSNAPFRGSLGANPPAVPIVGVAPLDT
jgi:ribosomal protein L24E